MKEGGKSGRTEEEKKGFKDSGRKGRKKEVQGEHKNTPRFQKIIISKLN